MINNHKLITVTCEEGSLALRVLEPTDCEASRSRMAMVGVGPVPLASSNVAAPTKRKHSMQAVWAYMDRALPEENIDFGETFPSFSAFRTLCFLRRGPP